jgi:hypothetical protein
VPLAWTALPFTPPDTTSALGTTVSSALDGLEHHIMQVSNHFLFPNYMSLTSGVVANIIYMSDVSHIPSRLHDWACFVACL